MAKSSSWGRTMWRKEEELLLTEMVVEFWQHHGLFPRGTSPRYHSLWNAAWVQLPRFNHRQIRSKLLHLQERYHKFARGELKVYNPCEEKVLHLWGKLMSNTGSCQHGRQGGVSTGLRAARTSIAAIGDDPCVVDTGDNIGVDAPMVLPTPPPVLDHKAVDDADCQAPARYSSGSHEFDIELMKNTAFADLAVATRNLSEAFKARNQAAPHPIGLEGPAKP